MSDREGGGFRGSRQAPLAAFITLAVGAAGCASERWVTLDVQLPAAWSRGSVCILAIADQTAVYRQRFDARSGTLTLIEGDRAQGEIEVLAAYDRGGRRLAQRRARVRFETAGAPVAIALSRCDSSAMRDETPTMTAPSGARSMVAADLDADGVDELYFMDGVSVRGASGANLDLESVLAVADTDDDCAVELWGLRAGAVAAASAADLPRRIDGDALAFGDVGRGPTLFVAGPSGASEIDIATVERRALSGAPARDVQLVDLDGDGPR